MKGPILCAALCAALFTGGCGESTTGHNPLMDEGQRILQNPPQQEIEQVSRAPVFARRPRLPELRPQGDDDVPVDGKLSAAEANAAADALRRVLPDLRDFGMTTNDDLKKTLDDAKRQLDPWCNCRAGADAAIYFNDEDDSAARFLSNYEHFPNDISLSVRWLRQQAAASILASRYDIDSPPLELPKGGDEQLSFFCSLQIYEYLKALVMRDEKSAGKIAEITHNSRNAQDAKNLGRQVSLFTSVSWLDARFEVMSVAVRAKFGAGSGEDVSPLGRQLLNTGQVLLAKASPNDSFWGIGAGAKAGRAGAWKGVNVMGWVLMEVRAELRGRSLP